VDFIFKLLFKIDELVDDLEYRVGNFFDPPAKFIKGKDDTESWCQRITTRQALRYTKYMAKRSQGLAAIFGPADFSSYRSKDRKLLEELRTEVLRLCEYEKQLYLGTLKRKMTEER